MKYFSILFIVTLTLSGCSVATVEPTSTIPSSPTPTITSTNTPNPTSTSEPTVTLTPSLPTAIEIISDSGVSEQVSSFVEKIVNLAYLYYVGLGCSPDGFKVRITNYESGEAKGPGGFITGWANPETEPKMAIRISHETAHTMCQIAFSKSNNMGAIDVRWLTEGAANYFSAMERIANSGNINGIAQSSIEDNTLGMAIWISQNFCNTPLSSLEPPNADRILQDYAAVGDVATRLLVLTNPHGVKAIMDYYTLLASMPNGKAFEIAFGTTKQEFYKYFQTECRQGFPAIYKNIPTATPAPTNTPAPGAVRIQGSVKLKDGGQILSPYVVTTCKLQFFQNDDLNSMKCSPVVKTKSDGSFSIYLVPGTYWIIVNTNDGSGEKAWYFEDDLLKEPQCGNNFMVDKDENVSIIIDLDNTNVCQ